MEFTTSFQVKVLVLLNIDKDFYLQNKKYVKPNDFNSLFLNWEFKLLDTYYHKYKSFPTRTVIEEEMVNDENLTILDEEEPLVKDFLAFLSAGFLTDADYIKEKFEQWIRANSIKRILGDNETAIESGDFDALTVGLRKEAKDFYTDHNQIEETFNLLNLEDIYNSSGGIKTGIGLIDNVIGGCMPRELSLLLADTNAGKSLLLTYIMGNAVRKLHKILHITLEMSRPRTLIRYYTTLAEPEDNIKYRNILNFDPEDAVLNYVLNLRDKYEKYLNVVEIPTSKCTVEDLYRLLDKYPDTELLAIDYMDLMRAPTTRKEKREESFDLVTTLRGLASEANIHIMTPTQANRTAANRRIVENQHVAEDYNKVRVADWAVAIGQNKKDKNSHQAVLSIPRSRNSEKEIAERYLIDFSSMSFRFMRQEVQYDDTQSD